MDKQELIRDMKQTFGGAGLLTIKQIRQYRKMCPNSATKFLKGLEYTTNGKAKYYFVGDIAKRILEKKCGGSS